MAAASSKSGRSEIIFPFESSTTEYPELHERAIEIRYSIVRNDEFTKCCISEAFVFDQESSVMFIKVSEPYFLRGPQISGKESSKQIGVLIFT